MSEWKVALSDISLGEEEAQAVADVVRSRWLTAGPKTAELESRFAARHGVSHALAVTNCTAALELAYAALGLGPGDEVIVPSLTFVATANAVRAVGATPVFCDIASLKDLTASPDDIARRITPRTKAVAVVHYGGYPSQLDRIVSLCDTHKLALVEDCAHSPGASYQGRPLGSFGAVGCFSFFGNKNMTTGEGGMLTTSRPELAEKMRLLRSHGMTTGSWDRFRGHASAYDVVLVGHNQRFDDLRAAVGLVQLDRLDANNARRGELVRRYREALRGLCAIPFDGRDESSFHLMVVVLPEGCERASVMAAMKADGVQTSIHYPPAHLFSVYAQNGGAPSLPVLESIAPRLLTLPLFPAMSDAQLALVVSSLRRALAV
jgi:dTDP-4-amino-4,6-dideoxygalactose transaminase